MYCVSYFITLMYSVNGFTELKATLVSELGYYVGIHFKQVEFELNIYISIIYRVCEIVGWPPLMENPGYATDKLH